MAESGDRSTACSGQTDVTDVGYALLLLRGTVETTNQEWRKRPARLTPAGPWPVQLRYPTEHTGEQYVSAEAWSAARLPRCPNHPHGGCSFARHGTYRRKTPAGTLIARWYCPESHTTFSLLPDCLAARLPGTLDEMEAVVAYRTAARRRSGGGSPQATP